MKIRLHIALQSDVLYYEPGEIVDIISAQLGSERAARTWYVFVGVSRRNVMGIPHEAFALTKKEFRFICPGVVSCKK